MSGFAALILFVVAAVLSYFTMTFGWGLEVHSWLWYILGTAGTALLMGVAGNLKDN